MEDGEECVAVASLEEQGIRRARAGEFVVLHEELGVIAHACNWKEKFLASFEMYQLTFCYPIGPSHKDSNFVSSVQTCLRIVLLPEAYFL